MAEPSLLEYARYFGLTLDHLRPDLNDQILAFCVKRQSRWQRDHNNHIFNPDTKLVDIFERAAQKYLSPHEDEISTPSHKVSDYFEYCKPLSDSTRSHILQDCDDTFRRRKSLKLPLPLLQIGGGNVEKDVAKIRLGIDLDRVLEEIVEEHQAIRKPKKERASPLADAQAGIWNLIQKYSKQTQIQETCEVTVSQLHFLKDAVTNQLTGSQVHQARENTLPERSGSYILHYRDISELDFDLDLGDEASYGLPSSWPPVPSSFLASASEQHISNPSSASETPLEASKPAQESIKLYLGSPVVREPWEEFINLDYFDEVANSDEANQLPNQKVEAEDEAMSKSVIVEHVAVEPDENSEITKWSMLGQPLSTAQACVDSALKIPMSDLLTHRNPIPELDMDHLFSHLLKCGKSAVIYPLVLTSLLKRLPFKAPGMRDVIHDVKLSPSGALDKYLAKPGRVVSSNDMLYKDPGLRVLDRTTEDNEDLTIGDYFIEEEFDNIDQMFPVSCLGKAEIVGTLSVVHEAYAPAHAVSECSTIDHPNTPKASDLTAVSVTKLLEKNGTDLGGLSRSNSKSCLRDVAVLKVRQPGQQMLGKRKREFEVEPLDASCTSSIKYSQPRQLPRLESHEPAARIPGPSESQSESLIAFLELRGKNSQRPMISKFRNSAELLDDPIECTQSDQFRTDSKMDRSTSSARDEASEDVPIPPWSSLRHARTIVVNSSLLQRKLSLTRYLEQTEQGMLHLLYRDLDLQQLPGADIILNTDTSILITSTQALDQRPLPGKKSSTGLSETHDNVARLAYQYSHVVVLVHYLHSADDAIRSRLMLTMTEFTSFCNQCSTGCGQSQCNITPLWLPCKDAASIAEVVNAWVWQMIQIQGYRNDNTPRTELGILLPEETNWEVFLTRFGVNPLAAQLMLALLKARGGSLPSGASEYGVWGLRKLAAMGPADRLDLFKGVLDEEIIGNLNENLQQGAS